MITRWLVIVFGCRKMTPNKWKQYLTIVGRLTNKNFLTAVSRLRIFYLDFGNLSSKTANGSSAGVDEECFAFLCLTDINGSKISSKTETNSS